jgi:hypothetical protein
VDPQFRIDFNAYPDPANADPDLDPGFWFYPLTFIKDAQATEEAFSPQRRTSSSLKHEISSLFLFL